MNDSWIATPVTSLSDDTQLWGGGIEETDLGLVTMFYILKLVKQGETCACTPSLKVLLDILYCLLNVVPSLQGRSKSAAPRNVLQDPNPAAVCSVRPIIANLCLPECCKVWQ